MNIKEAVIKVLKRLVERYPKNIQENYDSFNSHNLSYIDIGHSMTKNDKVWWWKNDEMELHVKPGNKYHEDYINIDYVDFWGRYDVNKNIISIAGANIPPPEL